jgi:serine/threonine protein kinase
LKDTSVGTLVYMAPELLNPPIEYSAKSDMYPVSYNSLLTLTRSIYALGVIFWEIALQRKPHDGKESSIQIKLETAQRETLNVTEITGSLQFFVFFFFFFL